MSESHSLRASEKIIGFFLISILYNVLRRYFLKLLFSASLGTGSKHHAAKA